MADVYSSDEIRRSRERATEHLEAVEEATAERREQGVGPNSFNGVRSVSHNHPSPNVKPGVWRGAIQAPPSQMRYSPIRDADAPGSREGLKPATVINLKKKTVSDQEKKSNRSPWRHEF